MNRRFRHKDEATDVLTFELRSTQANTAGDLAISAEIAAANAAELGHSTETELKILILHGLLHLAGYDHETDRGEMQAREAELRQHSSCRWDSSSARTRLLAGAKRARNSSPREARRR